MGQMAFTVGNYGRPRVGLPCTRLVNAYPEITPEGPAKSGRLQRPGLTRQFTLGDGPILRQFQNPGLFNGDLFTVSGGTLYRNTTSIGAVAYGLQPRMVASLTQLAIVSGGALYVYDGTTLTPVTTFDDGTSRLPSFSGVAVLYNIFVYPVAGTNQFFFSDTGDATKINAANFSNAETSPDPIIEVAVLAEELMFFGTNSMEFWDFTGVLAAPFALSQGRTYIRGTPAQGSVVKLDNAMFWVGDDLSVYRSSAVPVRVSTAYIEDRLREAGSAISVMTAFALGVEGHWFYVINLPSLNQSYAYDCQTQEWAQWGTQQATQSEPGLLLAGTSAGQGTSFYAGSATDGRVWLWDTANNTDDGIAIRVVVSAAKWTTAGRERLNSVGLACVRGAGTLGTPDPIVEMHLSKDGGRTFTSWMQGRLGASGEYGIKAVWRGLGLVSQPGVLVEFASADGVNFTAEGATYNEARY